MLALSFSDRLVLALLALALSALLGGPLWFYRSLRLPNPARLWDALVRYLEGKFNRNWRSQRDLRLRGTILTLLLVGVAWLGGLWLAALGRMLPYGAMLDLLLLLFLLPLRRLFDETLYVGRDLERGDLEAARKCLRGMARRNIGQLDAFAVVRTAIESLMENFTDKLLSPLFYYLLFGLPGILVAWAVTRINGVLATRAAHMAAFGWCAAKLDDLLHLLPARIGGVIIALAASLVPKGNLPRAFLTMIQGAYRFVSPNSGWPIAAAAGALGLTLGGPRSVQLAYLDDPWVGSGNLKPTSPDLRRALYLYAVSAGLLCFLLALACYWAAA